MLLFNHNGYLQEISVEMRLEFNPNLHLFLKCFFLTFQCGNALADSSTTKNGVSLFCNTYRTCWYITLLWNNVLNIHNATWKKYHTHASIKQIPFLKLNGDNNISLLYFFNSYYLYPENLGDGNLLTLYCSKASHPPKILKTTLLENVP